MEKFFKFEERQTNIKREVTAGLATFVSIAYVIFVNPVVLSQSGMDVSSAWIATCIAAAAGTLIMGLLTNYPFALAPGLGLTVFFTYTIVLQLDYTWQQGLGLVFISGIAFLLLTITGWRTVLFESVPESLRVAIQSGIGLFMVFIGVTSTQIIQINQKSISAGLAPIDLLNGTEVINTTNRLPLLDLELGNLADPPVLLSVIGLAIMAMMTSLRIKGGILIGVILVTVFALIFKVTPIPDDLFEQSNGINPTFFKLDLLGLFQADKGIPPIKAIFNVVIIVFTLALVDLLDSVQNLLSLGKLGEFINQNNKLPDMSKALSADASATTLGAILGTSTVTTYLENKYAVRLGGRTGFSALIVAFLFLLFIFLAPFAPLIPMSAIGPALIMTGFLFMRSIKKLNFNNLEEAIPALLTIIVMPFTISIMNGITAGIIFYVLLKFVNGKRSEIHPFLIFLAIIFLIRFFV